jgi:hypothetical protein
MVQMHNPAIFAFHTAKIGVLKKVICQGEPQE